jgi:hypothetical protein
MMEVYYTRSCSSDFIVFGVTAYRCHSLLFENGKQEWNDFYFSTTQSRGRGGVFRHINHQIKAIQV